MKDIVFRPETTIQRIVPFDQETLRSSFLVKPGEVKEVSSLRSRSLYSSWDDGWLGSSTNMGDQNDAYMSSVLCT